MLAERGNGEHLSAMGPVIGALWFQEKSGDEVEAATPMDSPPTHSELPWQKAPRTGRQTRVHGYLSIRFANTSPAGEDESDETIALPDAETVAKWLGDLPSEAPVDVRPDSLDELCARFAGAQKSDVMDPR
jgi:hypothetical protein